MSSSSSCCCCVSDPLLFHTSTYDNLDLLIDHTDNTDHTYHIDNTDHIDHIDPRDHTSIDNIQ